MRVLKRVVSRRGGGPAAEWPTSTPEGVSLDGAALRALGDAIARGELGNIHALLLVRDGVLAFERYFAGDDWALVEPLGRVEFGPDTLHDLRSVTKSLVGALVGIAHGDGAIPDLDVPLVTFFPEYAKRHGRALEGRTLRHALTMTAGLSWDELSHPYWDPRNDENGMWSAADPLDYALSRTPVAPGGARFAYNGGMPVVLAAVVERTTGKPLDGFARERLLDPLGIGDAEWVQHESRIFVAASGLRLRPRDLARFGQLMLDGGAFAGRQIVPADYARASLEPLVETHGGFAPSYGYQWWVGGIPLALGNGGQRVALLGRARTVIVAHAGAYDSPTNGVERVLETAIAAIH